MMNIKVHKDFVKTEIYAETLDNKHALHKNHCINLYSVLNIVAGATSLHLWL